jgi:uncharacterized protein (DUF1501 family)
MLTRRLFLRGSAVVMAGTGIAPSWLARAAEGAPGKKKILVAIFLRGAADGLNIVPPFGEKKYYELRPAIGIPAPGQPNGAIDLDGRFGLHPALQPLKALWDNKHLAIVHAAGSPDPSRSHFDAQDYMESGTPGRTTSDGWMNRALPVESAASPLRAVAVGPQMPRTLRGERAAISVSDVQGFNMGGNDTSNVLESLYQRSGDRRLASTGTDAFAAMKMIQTINNMPFNPGAGAQYFQGGELGRGLQQLARLIKADVGVEAAFAEIGGWDHHAGEPNQMANVLRQFASSIDSFTKDMGDRMEDIVMVTMSEFGRTVQENGDAGTDHGHGSVMMVMGGRVAGGRVYGKWPGLEREQLYEGRDLVVTTDFRQVLGELVGGQLGQKNLGAVFPGYQMSDPLGLLRT